VKTYQFKGIRVNQAKGHDVFCFAAEANDIHAFAEIERLERQGDGQLNGFQRPQVAAHIKEIRDFLMREDAVLPNAVVVAFLDNVRVQDLGNGIVDVMISVPEGRSRPGFLVDGQQRLAALSGLHKPHFEVLVSAVVCKDYEELRKQFLLINNTRPLPKSLIHELLPTIDGLPERFIEKKFAASLVDRLNFRSDSALRGEIHQHTNPTGSLDGTAIQKMVMNSASDGALRYLMQNAPGGSEDMRALGEEAFTLFNDYFRAIKTVFAEEWENLNPKVSRLRHGAGLLAMGFVMEHLYTMELPNCSTNYEKFVIGLNALKPYTAWTSGNWRFGEVLITPWNGIQNNSRDIHMLTDYLIRKLKYSLRHSWGAGTQRLQACSAGS
jgi:DGQHR domain-containing protein